MEIIQFKKMQQFPLPLYLSNIWQSLEMPLINCKVKVLMLILIISFLLSKTKVYVPVVTLSIYQISLQTIALNLSRQKELDVDPKAIQQR